MAFTEIELRTLKSNVMYKIAIDVTEAIRNYVCERKENGEICDIYPSVFNMSLMGRRDAHYNIVIIKRERNDDTELKSIDLDASGEITNINKLLHIDYDYYSNTITFRLLDKEFGNHYQIDVGENSIEGIIRKYYLSERVYGTGYGEYSDYSCEHLGDFYGKPYAGLVEAIDDIIQKNVMGLYNFIDKHANDITETTHYDYKEDVDLL